ncbi:hypothetical protein [Acutalibacter muris]|uniref:hypothetical protein n=1 Tax=Acutalibacter muris TaxID=1796620 RepID=UPI001C3EDEDE|nr:hypothetical protein [Acutalibacter muris]
MHGPNEPRVITKEIPPSVQFTLAQAAFEAIRRDFERPEVREDYERWKAARAKAAGTAAQKST